MNEPHSRIQKTEGEKTPTEIKDRARKTTQSKQQKQKIEKKEKWKEPYEVVGQQKI